ncbi:hypothetical protein BN2476_230364 [Paraburkholderia piptadeniae]|uniref:Uncharacterized protein n=1 Tax=Paraburkholderia piptadeniae TaxID=1701573 RepID=A0A1N7RY41_9BURK|nr:hypothetical protein BN2476_230364 [Paraburkholderia piptadeniae]
MQKDEARDLCCDVDSRLTGRRANVGLRVASMDMRMAASRQHDCSQLPEMNGVEKRPHAFLSVAL